MGPFRLGAAALVSVTLAACGGTIPDAEKRSLDPVNVVDSADLNDIMLTVADPNEAVDYFRKSLVKDPERIDFLRGLAMSLLRAKRATEAVPVFEKLVARKDATHDDRVHYADALIRNGNWKAAETQLNKVPPTHETFKRYRLEAMIADSKKQWKKADSFYETAAGLTTTPASTYNNWGYSKLTRGDYKGAEALFVRAITQDSKLFTAKNNLVLARASQKNYALPLIPMTEEEKAQLLYTAGLTAIKQGNRAAGQGLLEEAIDTHPRHFDAAVRSLEALKQQS
ncbi:MAG: tetratricopeptide repeat protein [Pseudomonadota bacterium]